MPYITADAKRELEAGRLANNPGELTYRFTQTIIAYIEERGLSYAALAEVLGALEGAKLDLERRIITPYEEKKQRENGEVWPLELRAKANGTV